MTDFSISVKHDLDRAIRDLDDLARQKVPRATARALNKVAAQAKTQAAREIKDRYQIGTRMISKYISIARRASPNSLTVEVRAEGRPLPILAFKARQTRKGVTVEVVRGHRKLISHAFIKTTKSGHRGVFARTSARGASGYLGGSFQFRHGKGSRLRKKGNDLPIGEILTLGIPQAFSNQIVIERLDKLVRDKFPEVFRHELDFILGR